MSLVGEKVSVVYGSRDKGKAEVDGILLGKDSFMNVLIATEDGTMIIRGDSVREVKKKK